MTAHGLPRSADRRDLVVLAWEPSAREDEGTRLAALELLAALARRIGAALAVPIDGDNEAAFGQIVDALARSAVAVLPIARLDGQGTEARLPAAAVAQETRLAALASRCTLIEWDGGPCVGIDAEPGSSLDDAAVKLSPMFGARNGQMRVGWLRRRSAYANLPPGAHFAVDWPPYETRSGRGAAAVAESTRKLEVDYAVLAADLARRHAGDLPVTPSVLWSSVPSIDLPHSSTRIIGASPLKIAHAIDSAQRFVRNRAVQGVPFWVLRVAFDPDSRSDVAALPMLAAALTRQRIPSGASAHFGQIEVPASRTARIAAVVHLYYPELWAELAAAIATLPEPCDVFVSCPLRAREAVARMVRARFPRAVVFGISNLGRDVLPFLRWLDAVGAGRYEYVLKLHSKKSVHAVDPVLAPYGGGEGWRRRALDGLVGDHEHAKALLRALDAQPDVGVVAPAGLLYDQNKWRCATADLVATLCARLALPDTVRGCFPAGTMFWARMAALAPLTGAPAQVLDFEREAGQVDDTLPHAYERLIPLAAAARGYRTVDSAQLLS